MRILIPRGDPNNVQNGGCYGIQLPDGKKYDADRQGYIEVSDQRHLDWIQNSTVARDVGLRVGQTDFQLRKQEGKYCPKCAFHAHLWQKTCPRDGAELETS